VIVLSNVAFDCGDPARVAAFWRAALEYDDPEPAPEEAAAALAEHPEWAHLAVVDEEVHRHPRLFLQTVPEQKVGKNRVRPVLTGTDLDRLGELGAGRLEEGLLCDVEGNELRVVDSGPAGSPRFLAIEIDAADPASQAQFWSEMLGFTLEGTSCHPPQHWLSRVPLFPSFTFVPEASPKTAKNRLHFDFLCEPAGEDHPRLIAMGARDLVDHSAKGFITMQDPEGNEFDLGL
jgi:hypothetical protein